MIEEYYLNYDTLVGLSHQCKQTTDPKLDF